MFWEQNNFNKLIYSFTFGNTLLLSALQPLNRKLEKRDENLGKTFWGPWRTFMKQRGTGGCSLRNQLFREASKKRKALAPTTQRKAKVFNGDSLLELLGMHNCRPGKEGRNNLADKSGTIQLGRNHNQHATESFKTHYKTANRNS